MTYTSNLAAVSDRMRRARSAALIAAATVLVNNVKRGLRGGYTSGAFVTGNVMASVTRSEPEITPGTGEIRVGTNVRYALFWELGHHNPFTRRHERKEVWMPALATSADEMRAAYARVFKLTLG